MHRRQRPIRPRLQRQVQVLAQRGDVGHGRDRLGPQVLGMGAREADPANALDPAEGTQQFGEQRPAFGEVAAVRVHVLTEQRDLHDPVARQPLDLGDDLLGRAADLAPAHGRHDAERAAIVTADLDGDPRGMRNIALHRQRAREGFGVVRIGLVEDLRQRATEGTLLQQRCGPVHVVRAQHDVDVRCAGAHQVTVLLGEAPTDDDLEVGSRQLGGLEVPEFAVELVVGVLADAARVQHQHVGIFFRGSRLETVRREETGDALGVVLVHLTPVGVHEELARHAPQVRRVAGDVRPAVSS